MQETKFAQGETEETIEEWSEESEEQLSLADESCGELAKCLKDIDTEAREFEREQNHEKAMELEKQLLDQKFEAVLKKKELAEKSPLAVNSKCPRLPSVYRRRLCPSTEIPSG